MKLDCGSTMGPNRATQFVTMILLVLTGGSSFAASTINEADKCAWGANIGWINWRDSDGSASGAVIGEYFCSGFLWAANIGWIHLGDGAPANGIAYRNNDAADFGVNHDGAGRLRGLAYGANIGWVHFHLLGDPHVDLGTGRLSGFAWSANCGWINLGDATFAVKTDTITMGVDSDGDGIADAYELGESGDLTTLTALGDHDGDGRSDLAEYYADTSSFDVDMKLEIVAANRAQGGAEITLSWTSQPTRRYRIEESSNLAAGWATALDDIAPDSGAVTTRTLPLSATPNYFFRVQAFRPLAR
jgi:hypothetical protein